MPDHRKSVFQSLRSLRSQSNLRIAVLERPYFGARIQQVVPDAEVVLLNSPREYFDSANEFDALVMSAEAGSAWTLLYPAYNVVIPEDGQLTVSVGYPVIERPAVARGLRISRTDRARDASLSRELNDCRRSTAKKLV